jgi:hypothetical protein
MVYLPPNQSLKRLFNEIAIADFGTFQIAVLTYTQLVERRILSSSISVPERTYQTQGWVIYNQQLIAHLDNLKIESIFLKDTPFKPLRRLAPAVPLSFEIQGSHPLPSLITKQATFACELPETDFPYHTIFHNISPHFVRVYPFGARTNLMKQVREMLQDEIDFVAQNREQLKQVPFFQTRFDL